MSKYSRSLPVAQQYVTEASARERCEHARTEVVCSSASEDHSEDIYMNPIYKKRKEIGVDRYCIQLNTVQLKINPL